MSDVIEPMKATFPLMVTARAAADRWAALLAELHAAELDLRKLRGKEIHDVTVSPGLIRVAIPATALIGAIEKRRTDAMAAMMREFPGATEEQVSKYVEQWGRSQ